LEPPIVPATLPVYAPSSPGRKIHHHHLDERYEVNVVLDMFKGRSRAVLDGSAADRQCQIANYLAKQKEQKIVE
jgi:hypothetical protein